MSFKTWKQEFYPTPAAKVRHRSLKKLIEHSLRKWIGLRQKNLDRHGLYHANGSLSQSDLPGARVFLDIDAESCSLCQSCGCSHCNRNRRRNIDTELGPIRFNCPLQVIRGTICFERMLDETSSPYRAFVSTGYLKEDPEPMIALLRKALRLVKRRPHGFRLSRPVKE